MNSRWILSLVGALSLACTAPSSDEPNAFGNGGSSVGGAAGAAFFPTAASLLCGGPTLTTLFFFRYSSGIFASVSVKTTLPFLSVYL